MTKGIFNYFLGIIVFVFIVFALVIDLMRVKLCSHCVKQTFSYADSNERKK